MLLGLLLCGSLTSVAALQPAAPRNLRILGDGVSTAPVAQVSLSPTSASVASGATLQLSAILPGRRRQPADRAERELVEREHGSDDGHDHRTRQRRRRRFEHDHRDE